MDFKEIEKKKLLRSYEFTLKQTFIDQKVDEKLENARPNFQMKGFRKGHTPFKMMKKMFGDSTKNEVIQELIDKSLKKHLDKEILRFAVNQEYVFENIDLDSKDEIAVFPPVSGG